MNVWLLAVQAAALQQLEVFQRALQEISEDEEVHMAETLGSLHDSQAGIALCMPCIPMHSAQQS